MVSYKQILASNALVNDATAPRVAVFAGGTSGVGNLTIKALVSTGVSVRIYLIGRKSSEERAQKFISEMKDINPKAELVWTEGEISLMAETKRICEIIKAKESRVDLLFLTAGYSPFGKRRETAEGLEISQSLEYYTRMLFTFHLLPLMQAAEAPRVISVLAGGMERKTINLDDIDLKKPGNYGGIATQLQFGAMNSLTFDKLSRDYPDVTFMHSWPGAIDTGNAARGADPNTVMDWVVWLIMNPIIRLVGFSYDECGQRNLFQCTSAAYGGRGVAWDGKPGVNTRGEPKNGMFLVSNKCECTPNLKAFSVLRENAQEKVWEHTQEVVGPYL